jgi:hypothetical protein
MPVIKLVGLAGGQGASPLDGEYLVQYDPGRDGVDPNGNRMLAHIATSPRRADALVFETVAEAHACWTRVDPRQPVRADGRPNRPLTAFSVEILQ